MPGTGQPAEVAHRENLVVPGVIAERSMIGHGDSLYVLPSHW